MTFNVKSEIDEKKEIVALRKLIKSTWLMSASDAQIEKFLATSLNYLKSKTPRLVYASSQYDLTGILKKNMADARFNDTEKSASYEFYKELDSFLAHVYEIGDSGIKTLQENFNVFVKEHGFVFEAKVLSGSAVATDLKRNGKGLLPIEIEWNKDTLKSLQQFNQFEELYAIFVSGVFHHLLSVISYEQERVIHQELKLVDDYIKNSSGKLKNTQILPSDLVKSWKSPFLNGALDYLKSSNLFKQGVSKSDNSLKSVKQTASLNANSDFMMAMAGVKPLNKKDDTKSQLVDKSPSILWDQLDKKYTSGGYDVA